MPPSDFINAAVAPPDGTPPRQPPDRTPSSPPPDLSFLAGKLQEINTYLLRPFADLGADRLL